MKQSIQISALIIFTFLVVFPQAAMSEVMISLKNGRDIMADSCSDSKDRLVCEKMGGTFEIDKKDILKVSGIRAEKKPSDADAGDASGEVKKDAIPEMEAQTGSRKQESEISEANVKEKVVKGTDPEAEKRLDEIQERKIQLGREAEELNRERQQLTGDMKEAPDILTTKQFDDLNNRNIEIEGRISRFNEQLRALNDEEKKIIEGLRAKE
jgi:hypothetical protein